LRWQAMLQRLFEKSQGGCETIEHQPGGGDFEHGFRGLDAEFVVFAEAAVYFAEISAFAS
jgi:hypothetical protein